MSEQHTPVTKNENKGLGLAGLIISLVAILCALLPDWRVFALVLAIAGLLISAYALAKSRRTATSAKRPAIGLIAAAVAIVISVWFIYRTKHAEHEQAEPIPQELHDSAAMDDQDRSLESLKGIIDSTAH